MGEKGESDERNSGRTSVTILPGQKIRGSGHVSIKVLQSNGAMSPEGRSCKSSQLSHQLWMSYRDHSGMSASPIRLAGSRCVVIVFGGPAAGLNAYFNLGIRQA